MSDRSKIDTVERSAEPAPVQAQAKGLSLASKDDPLDRIALEGQRTIGAFTRGFALVGIVLCMLGMTPFVDGLAQSAALVASTGVAIVALLRYGRGWTLEIGLDGARCRPEPGNVVVPWSFIREAALEAWASTSFGPEVQVRDPYVYLRVAPRAGEPWTLFAFATPRDRLEAARDAINARAERARSFVEPEAMGVILRDGRALSQWKSALEALRADPFRSAMIERRTLRAAIESGALESRSIVECAFALAALGEREDRAWLGRVARALLNPSTRAAVEACAEGNLADVAIDRATAR